MAGGRPWPREEGDRALIERTEEATRREQASVAVTDVVPVAVGRVLALVIAAIGRFRGPRPIHTTGMRLQGTLRWRPAGSTGSGIAWIDERGSSDSAVVARLSRGAAVPAAFPDVLGLALRLGNDEGDLLLSTTGLGVPGRFVLRLRRTPARAVFSTLMPYRGRNGPVLVAARSLTPDRIPTRMEAVRDRLATQPWRLELLWATPLGRWHRFAEVELVSPSGPIDASALRFDPVLRPPRGAGTYGWTRALREPAYLAARRSRTFLPSR